MIGLNIRDSSSIDLSLRRCRLQLRISGRIAFTTFVRNCWTEVDEVLSLAILRSPRAKCIAQKIELLVRVRPPPVFILAIDHLRLLRMKLQPTFPQSCGYGRPNHPGLPLP